MTGFATSGTLGLRLDQGYAALALSLLLLAEGERARGLELTSCLVARGCGLRALPALGLALALGLTLTSFLELVLRLDKGRKSIKLVLVRILVRFVLVFRLVVRIVTLRVRLVVLVAVILVIRILLVVVVWFVLDRRASSCRYCCRCC